MNLLDINKDGIFSIEEQTDSWKYYENKVVGDGGMALIPYLLPFLLALSFIINWILLSVKKIKMRVRKLNNKE